MLKLPERRVLKGRSIGLVLALMASAIITISPLSTQYVAHANGAPSCSLTGVGSTASPYLISDALELYESVDCATSSEVQFLLTNDIDVNFSGSQEPIGFVLGGPSKLFSGTLNGAGYSITGISVSSDDSNEGYSGSTGLFWGINDATFYNMTLSGTISYTGASESIDVGGLSGFASGEISISNLILNIETVGYDSVGSLIGRVAEAPTVFISRTQNLGQVQGQTRLGGLIGFIEYQDPSASGVVQFHNVTNSGSISNLNPSQSFNVGGLIGQIYGGNDNANVQIISSENVANISFSISEGLSGIGGLIGVFEGIEIQISSSHNSGTLDLRSSNEVWVVGGLFGSGYVYAGGIWSSENTGEINAYADGAASASSVIYVGGLLGNTLGVNVYDSVNRGHIAAHADEAYDIGGVAGRMSFAELESSQNFGNLSVTNQLGEYIGGVVGYSYFSFLSQLSNTASVYAENSEFVAGIVGYISGLHEIYSSYNSGAVDGLAEVGGIVGGDGIVSSGLLINESYNSGTITGTSNVGGLVGEKDDGYLHLFHSFNTGTIVATNNNAGGLLGALAGSSDLEISNSYNVGLVSSSLHSAGLVGSAVSFGTVKIETSYNGGSILGPTKDGLINIDVSSSISVSWSHTLEFSDYTPSSTITQMKIASLYQNTEWDFENIWGFGLCTENYGLPMLRFAEETTTYYSTGCFDSGPSSNQIGSGKPYDGPIIQSVSPTLAANQPAQVTGIRLNTITEVFVGGQKVSFTLSNDVLTFQAPSLSPGRYQVVFYAPIAQINLFGNIDLLAQATSSRVNVGSFNGKLVVYASNLSGSQISWKVGGRWGKATATSNFARFDRPTPTRGVTVNVQIFVNGKLELTKAVRTR